MVWPTQANSTGYTELSGGLAVTVNQNQNNVNGFIPELWSDEILAEYEKSLVYAARVKKMSMVGQKGDTIHIPVPARGDASAKAENEPVTLITEGTGEVDILIDQHWEYSRLLEDKGDVQALSSYRRFITEDAGYALARQVDTNLFGRSTEFGDGTYAAAALDGAASTRTGADFVNSNAFYNDITANGGAGAAVAYAVDTVANGDIFTDRFFRDMIQKQDDADTPMADRYLIIPPSGRNQILGIDRYVSTDFIAGRPVVNGLIGNLYGIDIYVSTNVPVIEAAGQNTANTFDVKGAILAHRDTTVMAEQVGVRSQTQYKQEYLSTLFTSDRLYGTRVCRPESGFILAMSEG